MIYITDIPTKGFKCQYCGQSQNDQEIIYELDENEYVLQQAHTLCVKAQNYN